MIEDNILTVSQITGEIKEALETSFTDLNVIGEISNFKDHVSGHWYFTLKDKSAQINCTMWRGINNYVFFTPQDGMKIIASGKITVYPPRGNYQLDVKSMKPAGQGELQAAYEKLKAKLSAEGLFDVIYKKEIPSFPKRIGIVTAKDGAAFKDMITTAKRRFPLAELVISPAKVQGEGAAIEIAKSISELNSLGDIDVMIVGRGGGSLEDLWAFNEEVVARAIFKSEVPIISAVGHEIDFSISDFVADLRAATPTAAMELATPNRDEIFAFINEFYYSTKNNISNLITNKQKLINNLISSYGFRSLVDKLKIGAQSVDSLINSILRNVEKSFIGKKNIIDLLNSKIAAMDSKKILARGYSIIFQNGKVIPRRKTFLPEEDFIINFFDEKIEIKQNGKSKK